MTPYPRKPWIDPRELDAAHNDTPPPPRLTLIRELGRPIEHLPDIAAAAASICALRPPGAGLRLVKGVAHFGGGPTYETTAVYVTPPGSSMEEWVGHIALSHAEHAALRTAVRDHAAQLRAGGRKAA